MITVIILAIIGLVISAYGIIVEQKLKQDVQFKPACDISDTISCSRAFQSPYGKMLGISNIWASALYYCAILILTILHMHTVCLMLTCAGLIVSIMFAYVLYIKIRTLCPICTSLYVINIILALACYFS